jgi:hypothetical protein
MTELGDLTVCRRRFFLSFMNFLPLQTQESYRKNRQKTSRAAIQLDRLHDGVQPSAGLLLRRRRPLAAHLVRLGAGLLGSVSGTTWSRTAGSSPGTTWSRTAGECVRYDLEQDRWQLTWYDLEQDCWGVCHVRLGAGLLGSVSGTTWCSSTVVSKC